MKQQYNLNQKVLFSWFGTNKIGHIHNVHKLKNEQNKTYYEYDIWGEDDKIYNNIPILIKRSNLGIHVKLTKKMFNN